VALLFLILGLPIVSPATPATVAATAVAYTYDASQAHALQRQPTAAPAASRRATQRAESALAQWKSEQESTAGVAAEDSVPLFRQGAAIPGTGGRAVEPTLEAVQSVASRAGADLRGIKITINRDEELLGRQLYGHTPDVGNITLYPDAFTNEESMAATLGHELNHVYQLRTFGPAMDTEIGQLYENASFAVEQSYLDYFRLGG
jgi:hypothetical protein